ncbi:Polysaccharide biosynthesis protein [Gemmata sp. SH-PL17]|uniref:lipopolysaccharide biosynthesis protein n=1 Tax=Gemmata sp. SH-PL17 TaxID=1630693 RepID=UPI00078CFF51|nr:oligosaccharide flippase family protein [Gemmata sp. SH-PL17]AMV27730.1 Polysaccharide biosynthesis protein [Gemmata sp. SH-PL17]
MSNKQAIKRNVLWNSAGLAVEVATGFLILPFLIARLGNEMYGIWLILGSLTVYLSMLELGVRGSIGRHISLYHAREDQTNVNRTLTAGTVLLFCAGAIIFLALIAAEQFFFRLYPAPDGTHAHVALTYRLMAANIAVILIGTAFDAALWGYQRFDWINAVDIPFSLIRTVLTLSLVHSDKDITTLGFITLSLWTASTLCKAFLTFRADPKLRVGTCHLSKSSFRELLGYGSWNVIATFARLSRTQLAPIFLGSYLSLAIVPVYAIAARLVAATVAAMNAATGVLTPHATSLHATNQTDRQRQLLIIGSRYSTTFGIFITAYLFILGAPLIALWVGPDFSSAATLLTILILGESLPCTQYVTNGIILATARHRTLAVFALLEAIAICVIMVALLPSLGLIGAGLALAVPAFFTRGVAPLIQGCRITGVPVIQYLKQAIAPPILCAVIPAVALKIAIASHPATSWLTFVTYSTTYTALFALCLCGTISNKKERLSNLRAGALTWLSRSARRKKSKTIPARINQTTDAP